MNVTALLIANLVLAAQPADPGRGTFASVLELPSCLISLIDDVSLPAQEAGVLQEMTAKEGHRAQAGDVLAKVDETETLLRQKAAKLKLDVANEKATNDAEVRVARAIVELAKAEYEESIAINKSDPPDAASSPASSMGESGLGLRGCRHELKDCGPGAQCFRGRGGSGRQRAGTSHPAGSV
jgi:hypothetical protein